MTYSKALEKLFYNTYSPNYAGWISLEDQDGNDVDIDFNFESDFTPQFDKWFVANPTTKLYARFRAAEKSDPYVSDRILLHP